MKDTVLRLTFEDFFFFLWCESVVFVVFFLLVFPFFVLEIELFLSRSASFFLSLAGLLEVFFRLLWFFLCASEVEWRSFSCPFWSDESLCEIILDVYNIESVCGEVWGVFFFFSCSCLMPRPSLLR